MLAEAEAYNEKLSGLTTPIEMSDEALEEYNKLLDVTGTGIMGYIEIDKIDCKLPIYHTADDEVMQLGAGHLEGTSLPVGGESTHSVICGHRGLPSSKLFTDLDQMEVGDNFVIHILNETLTYEVDQILVVDPDDTSALGIEEGKDLVTLFTCTPYGINTHRLLVRGHRVPNTEESVEPVSTMSSRTIKASFIIAVVFIVIMVLVLVVGRKKSKK
jgi:sortase A